MLSLEHLYNRYEWSIGVSIEDEPKGIFDSVHERVWHDAGTTTEWIYSLPKGIKCYIHVAITNNEYQSWIYNKK